MILPDPIAPPPPRNEEAEAAVLGAVLLDPSVAPVLATLLRPEHFYCRRYRLIWQVVLDLLAAERPLDPVLIRNTLTERGELESVGGPSVLVELADGVPSAANAEAYSRLVRHTALARALIATCQAITHRAYANDGDLDQLLEDAEAQLLALVRRRSGVRIACLRDELEEALATLEGGEQTGLPTGLTDLDGKLLGLHAGELTILAGRPSQGKSTLAATIARNVTLAGTPVGFFSLEVGRARMAQNVVIAEARIDAEAAKRGRLTPQERLCLRNAVTRLRGAADLAIDDSALSMSELRARARQLHLEAGVGLVVVDYIQLLASEGRAENRQTEVAALSRGLKLLARELKLPVLALSQLSRAVEAREDRRPRLSDLRESGALEQDADVVLMLYRPAYYAAERGEGLDEETKTLARLVIAKNRHGPTGEVRLRFFGQYLRFDNYTEAPA